jgi:solute carrier family 25 (mitochondrial carnitine/acylcarnitine transporter), member 20/29
MFDSMNNSIAAFFSGLSFTIIGHPLDTLKTWKQNNNNIIKSQSINLKNLYKGVQYPLLQNSMINSIIFANNDFFKKKTNNIYISNACSGLLSSFIICPFDKFKIMAQQKLYYPVNLKNIIYTYKDLDIVTMRKLPGIFIYFTSYQKMRNENIPIFLSGSLAGTFSWLITYPIDTIKTRMQNESCKTIKEAFAKGNLTQGLHICLIRAFITNGINFTVYEKTLQILNNK